MKKILLNEEQIKRFSHILDNSFEIDNKIEGFLVERKNWRIFQLLTERIISSDVLEKTQELMRNFEDYIANNKLKHGEQEYTVKTQICNIDLTFTFYFSNGFETVDDKWECEGRSFLIGGILPVASVSTVLFKGRFQNGLVRSKTEEAVIHEINHVYQELKKKYNHSMLMSKANTDIYSDNPYQQQLANIVYAGNTTEQISMCNELYVAITNTIKKGIPYNKEKQNAFKWLDKLYTAKKFLEENRDNPKLLQTIKRYTEDKTLDYKNINKTDIGIWKYKKFKNRCNTAIEEFEARIKHTIAKALTDLVEDGTMETYNVIDTQFFL